MQIEEKSSKRIRLNASDFISTNTPSYYIKQEYIFINPLYRKRFAYAAVPYSY